MGRTEHVRVELSTFGSDARRLGRLKGGNEAGEVRRFP